MDHRIDRVKFDVSFSDGEEARDLQDKVFSICRNGLVRAVDGVLEKFDLELSIEKLELDLGKIKRRDLDQKLLDELADKLTEALQNQMQELLEHQSSEKFQLEALTLFLEKGLKHWSDLGHKSLKDLFREALRRSTGSLFRFFVNTRHKETVVARVISLIDEGDFRDLISKMRPAEASFILGFIADVKKVNSSAPFSPATTGQQLDQRLRQLVLLDLINEYGSAFNRRMFIERNLRALAREFGLSYLEILDHFERVLTEEIPFEMNNTFPALIRTISENYQDEMSREKVQPLDYNEVFQTLIELTGGLHPRLEESYEEVLEEYSGELRSYLQQHTYTSDQVKAMVSRLNVDRMDRMITIIEPQEDDYIRTYVRGVKGISREQLEHKSDQAMHTQIYEIVFGYLLIDRGTRFNQKAFLRYQLKGMGQATGITYVTILNLLQTSLNHIGSVNLSTGILVFLKEFLSEEKAVISYGSEETETKFDDLLLVKEYLKSGTIPVYMREQQQIPFLQYLTESVVDQKIRLDLFEFLMAEKQKVLASMVDFKTEEFEQVVRIILLERWGFTISQSDQFVDHLRKIERQAVYPVGYRKVVFQLLISSSFKAERSSHPLQSTREGDVSEILFYQLSEQLSLPKIMSHSDFQNSMAPNQYRERSFDKSRKRLLLAIENIHDVPEPFEKAAIREAFDKIQESDFETFTLLDHLKTEEVSYIFEHLEKHHYQKLIEQLAIGKWQLLKKSLLLMIKGTSMQQPQTSQFFAVLFQRRHHQVNEVFMWINQSYSALQLSNYYVEQIQLHHQKVQEKLSSSRTDAEAGTTYVHELETLIAILSDVNFDEAHKDVAHVVFNQLLKDDATALVRKLRELSFYAKEVSHYVERLGPENVSRWIRLEVGANYQSFVEHTETVERLLKEIFRKDKSIPLNENKLLAIRLMLANRTGNYSVDFGQVLKFYMQALSEHSVFKYRLVQKWLSTGYERVKEQSGSWMSPKAIATIEEELRPVQDRRQEASDGVVEEMMEKSEALSGLKVPNAGLVLLWPFYQRLFSMLDYLDEEGGFKSIVEKSKAVRLLHHISGFDWDEPEYNLTLNKILCGMPFSERMEPYLKISEKETTTAEELLHGVIQNWDRLGNTSIEGLQVSFLKRDGILEKEDGSWKLKVEKKGMDVLIDHMPWSYASVVLRWMPEAMYVDWR